MMGWVRMWIGICFGFTVVPPFERRAFRRLPLLHYLCVASFTLLKLICSELIF